MEKRQHSTKKQLRRPHCGQGHTVPTRLHPKWQGRSLCTRAIFFPSKISSFLGGIWAGRGTRYHQNSDFYWSKRSHDVSSLGRTFQTHPSKSQLKGPEKSIRFRKKTVLPTPKQKKYRFFILKENMLNFGLGFLGSQNKKKLGGGFTYFLFSSRTLGKMNPFWLMFFKGVGSTTN